uniref:G_PROTEIN_RECEP_F1_2 domain-containing protein n=1 Tax=Haemonchus contortus TaxID=6289 RepID=A0A7I4YXV6_HAECO
MTRPYTYIYWTFNIALQIVCALIVALVDFIIIWKIYQLRGISGLAKRNAFTLTQRAVHRNHGRISNEIRLALNFLLLSVCFLAMTICFNIPLKNGILKELLTKLTCNLNSAKWAIYALGSPTIRSGVLRFLKCRRNDPTNATTSIMGRHTKT